MVHTATTPQTQSIQMLLSLAAMMGFEVRTSYVKQAYLQFSEPTTCEMFIIEDVEEFERGPSQALQLMKHLYGLCESGDLWHAIIDKNHRKKLYMTPLKSDVALYMAIDNGRP